MTDEELAMTILGESSSPLVTSFMNAGEWAQVGIEGLWSALDGKNRVNRDLVNEALRRWPNDMGSYLAEKFAALLTR